MPNLRFKNKKLAIALRKLNKISDLISQIGKLHISFKIIFFKRLLFTISKLLTFLNDVPSKF